MAQKKDKIEADEMTLKSFLRPSHQSCSRAFYSFLSEYEKHTSFFFFLISVTSKLDANRVRAAKALALTTNDPEAKKRYEESAKDEGATLRELKGHKETVSQNLTNGIVNAFQRYFSAIVADVCRKKPEILTSSKEISLKDVMRFSKRSDLISFIVDRQVNDLSYGGISELEKFFKDRLGLELFESQNQKNLLRIFFEVRNINVHNGGIANEIFAERVKKAESFNYEIGKQIHLDYDDIVRFSMNALNVAKSVDARVVSKFKLQKKLPRTWGSTPAGH